MATDLTTPSNSLVKMRWKEPYVSEGLNKKFNGLVPHGVIRGGRLGTNALDLRITVEADPDTGDSIYSVIDANGHQLTFRQVGDITLDLTALASTTVYIGLEVTYSTSVATSVKWRAYSQAEIDADPTIVCLGGADVPASGTIPAADIFGDRRTDGGMSISSGMQPWAQILKNPSFEGHEVVCTSSDGFNGVFEFPQYRLSCPSAVGQIHSLTPLSTPTSTPRTGDGTLAIEGGGVGNNVYSIDSRIFQRVSPGQLIRASVWIRGSSVSFGSGASGYVALAFFLYEWDGSLSAIVEEKIDGTVLTGTFDYIELSHTLKIPSNISFFWPSIQVYETTSLSGVIELDDYNIWLEPGPVSSPYIQDSQVVGREINTDSLVLNPSVEKTSTDPAETLERSIKLVCQSGSPSSLEYSWKLAKAAVTSWIMSLPKGVIDVGSDLIASAAEAIVPRLKTSVQDSATAQYTLLWEITSLEITNNKGNIRVYATNLTNSLPFYFGATNAASFLVTMNAEWNGSAWVRDVSADSMRYDLLRGAGFFFYIRESTATSPWDDADWEDFAGAGDAFLYFASRAYALGKGEIIVPDGRFRFVATSTDATGSNPAYTVTPEPNTLYAKNICKAWVKFGTDSGFIRSPVGFNLVPGAPASGGGVFYLPFTFNEPMAVDDEYSVVATAGYAGSGAVFPDVVTLHPYDLVTTGFKLRTLHTGIGSPSNTANANLGLETNEMPIHVQVFGRQ